MKLLILGSTGLLGCSLAPFLASCGHEIATHGRSHGAQYQADLDSKKKTDELLDKVRPEAIINLVGLTDVDLCEAKPNQAYLTNVRTLENITVWIARQTPPPYLLHISTDQLYDGAGPHAEDQVALTNCYAFSKYAAELVATSVSSTILRTNFFGRSRCSSRASLTDWIFRSISARESIQVFDDVLFSPLSMATLREMIERILQKKPVGVFNVGSHMGMSKADFAFTFAEELGLSPLTMKRTTIDQVAFLKTYRPRDMRMDCSKFERELSVKLPRLGDEIMRVAKEYREVA